MKTFTLSNDEPEIEFKLNSAESYLLIKNVKFISVQNLNNQWANFISKIKLTAELGYIVQLDKESGIMDERKL
jgi:hypothetical protein